MARKTSRKGAAPDGGRTGSDDGSEARPHPDLAPDTPADMGPRGEEVLRELQSLARALDVLNGAVQRLHEKLSRFLPKMASSAADGDLGEGATREVGIPAEVDDLVEDKFREIFGEEAVAAKEASAKEGAAEEESATEEPVPAAAMQPSPSGESPEKRRASGLRLRVQQGDRILEVPWSWVPDSSAREIEEQGRGVGRIRLEDETGEADIPVDRVLGVVLSSTSSEEDEAAFRPQSVQDLIQWRTGQVKKAGSSFDTSDLERLNGSRVAVASRSGIVRRFLRRHLEDMGLVVLETEDPQKSFPTGELLGVFWDRDLSSRNARPPDSLPVVQLSHQVEQSKVSPEASRPLLAKPFSRDEVAQALVWMESRSGSSEVVNRGESQSRRDTSTPRSGRGDTSPGPSRQ
jgi:hypothetical protein